jgi:hypothetical protein
MTRLFIIVLAATLVGCSTRVPYPGNLTDVERAVAITPAGLTRLSVEERGQDWIRYRLFHDVSGIYLKDGSVEVRVESGQLVLSGAQEGKSLIRKAAACVTRVPYAGNLAGVEQAVAAIPMNPLSVDKRGPNWIQYRIAHEIGGLFSGLYPQNGQVALGVESNKWALGGSHEGRAMIQITGGLVYVRVESGELILIGEEDGKAMIQRALKPRGT